MWVYFGMEAEVSILSLQHENKNHTISIVVPQIELSVVTYPQFSLNCSSMGAPGVISWSYTTSSRTYTSDGTHTIRQALVSGYSSTIESTLTFSQHPYNRDTGERSCKVTTTYVSTNNSETNTSTTTGLLINYIPLAV